MSQFQFYLIFKFKWFCLLNLFRLVLENWWSLLLLSLQVRRAFSTPCFTRHPHRCLFRNLSRVDPRWIDISSCYVPWSMSLLLVYLLSHSILIAWYCLFETWLKVNVSGFASSLSDVIQVSCAFPSCLHSYYKSASALHCQDSDSKVNL